MSGETANGGGVFARTDTGLVPLQEQPYEAEEVLQRLLAETPELLSGDGDPTGWLLVGREIGVADAPDAGDRWSLDHLFLDSDGVPTLVEVKRSANSQIRREVVGQMLDYAANARHSWADGIRSMYEARCARHAWDPVEHLQARLGPDTDPDVFWSQVQENLSAGRLRLVFVADQIPSELRAIVEFLNEQMTKTEVVAVEVRQFLDEDRDHQMFVARMIGRTHAADEVKGNARRRWRRWTREQWFEALAERRQHRVALAEEVFSWAEARGLATEFGTGVHNPSAKFSVPGVQGTFLYLYLEGGLDLSLDTLRKTSAFAGEAARNELIDKLNALPGVEIPRDKLWPSIPLRALEQKGSLEAFLRVMDEALDRLGVTRRD